MISIPTHELVKCPECNGLGKLIKMGPCKNCGGQKVSKTEACRACDGKGLVWRKLRKYNILGS